MKEWQAGVDAFLAGLPDGRSLDELVSAFAEPGVPAPSAVREAIARQARLEGRFDHFAPDVARMLEVSEETACTLLDGIGRGESWVAGPVPGVLLYHVAGGPS